MSGVRGQVPLQSSLRLPAKARWYAEVADVAQLPQLLCDPQWQEIPRVVLGEGSNVVLSADLPALVLRPIMRGIRVIEWQGGRALVECQAGESWDQLVQWSIDQGLAGLENLSLIPGSVGAAPFQNIGAYGVELADVFDSLEACSLVDGVCRRFSPSECRFAYRDSFFKSVEPGRWLVSSVRFWLDRDREPVLAYADLASRYQALPAAMQNAAGLRNIICELRRSKLPDPAEMANAGSFFKNPVVSAQQHVQLKRRFPELVSYPQRDGSFKLAAGWLIEQAGWKGRREGNVGMHSAQALVLVNYADATGEEVLQFASRVRESVKNMFSVELEQEPVILPALEQGGTP